MDVLRNRLVAALATLAFAAAALPACGDDDGRGAAEEIERDAEKGAKEVERGAERGAKEVEQEGNELDDDLKGTDEKNQRDK